MKLFATSALLSAAVLGLSACGGNGDDALGDQAADRAEARADNIEAMADNATGTEKEALEDKADRIEDQGEAREEAIDESDVDADELSDAQKNALIDAQ